MEKANKNIEVPRAAYALVEKHLYDLIKIEGSQELNEWLDAKVAIYLHKMGRMFKRKLIWPLGMGEQYKCILTRKQLNVCKKTINRPLPHLSNELNSLVGLWKKQQANNPNLVIL